MLTCITLFSYTRTLTLQQCNYSISHEIVSVTFRKLFNKNTHSCQSTEMRTHCMTIRWQSKLLLVLLVPLAQFFRNRNQKKKLYTLIFLYMSCVLVFQIVLIFKLKVIKVLLVWLPEISFSYGCKTCRFCDMA